MQNIDESSLAGFAEYAKRKNKSVAAEIRDIIAERGESVEFEKLLARIKKRREEVYSEYGPLEDSVTQVRAVRDEK